MNPEGVLILAFHETDLMRTPQISFFRERIATIVGETIALLIFVAKMRLIAKRNRHEY